MMIQVHYPDNHFDYVADHALHGLIESGKIMRFKRSSGWVVIGFDELRQSRREDNQKHLVKVKRMIRVLYNDNRYDYVTDEMLDNLLESEKIFRFERTGGWATVGIDPIRLTRRDPGWTRPDMSEHALS